jgi:hypothetical protein
MIKDRVAKLGDPTRTTKQPVKADVAKNCVLLMKYFGWTLSDIERLTVPQYFELVKIINEVENENKQEQQKGKNNGRHNQH